MSVENAKPQDQEPGRGDAGAPDPTELGRPVSGEAPPIEIPPGSGGGANRNVLWLVGAVVVAAIILGLAWTIGGGSGEPEEPAAPATPQEIEALPTAEQTGAPTEAAGGPGAPPTAVITAPSQATVGQLVAFDAERSSGEDPLVLYLWDFGDGARASDPVVEHSYHLAGTYLVTLVVVDSTRQQGRAHTYIAVSEAESSPPTAQIAGPSNSLAGDSVTFDASGSKPGDAAISGYFWSLGNGQTGQGLTITATYDLPGTYQVHLVVTDENGLSDSASLTLIVADVEASAPAPPTALIGAPGSALVGEAVVFDGAQSAGPSPIVAYRWDFGDGNQANAVQIVHAYGGIGSFVVTLEVTDSEGQSGRATHTIAIEAAADEPPTAAISAPTSAEVGEPVVFDGTSSRPGSAPIASYRWDFGNGRGGQGPTITTIYDLPGAYQVLLSVADENGLGDGVSHEIVVNATLENTQWILSGTAPGTRVTAAFTSGAVSGSGGCNSYSGSYVAGGNQLAISSLVATQRFCEEPIASQESAYLEALAGARGYSVQAASLTIDTATGVLAYTAAR